MWFAVARENEMGNSWENEDAVVWTESASTDIILCKPSGTFAYTAAWDPSTAEVTLSESGAVDGGQAV